MFSLIVPTLVGIVWWPVLCVTAFALCAYLLVVGFVSAKLAIDKGLNFLYLLVSFVVLHVSYGWGSLMGIVKLPFMK